MSENEFNHSGHRERLKQHFVNNGVDALKDYELLELLLFYAIPRRDTQLVARRLIEKFENFNDVFDAPIDALKNVDGIGENTAILIKMLPALTKRYLTPNETERIDLPSKAAKVLIPKFIGIDHEQLYLLCLNNYGVVKKCALISDGAISHAELNARKVLEEAINSHATAAILAHNHPSGLLVPSSGDKVVTRQVSSILANIEVVLKDHIIIHGEEYFAMAQNAKFAGLFEYSMLKSHVMEGYVSSLISEEENGNEKNKNE